MAFVPDPLPPNPPLALQGRLQGLLEQATLAVGRLDKGARMLPDLAPLLYSYVRREAVLSSQIEGTESSLSDLLTFEAGGVPGVPTVDVVETSNYVAALDHGIKRLRGGFPLSNRLIREVHKILLSRGRGGHKDPGHFRRTQNWIGGSRPGDARFVPPPPQHVEDCMASLERFLHGEGTDLPALVRAGIAHVQFETIHPFLDGNGRVGRALITLLLCAEGVLREPLLYLSLFLKRNRADYYALLDTVRREGDWEAWLEFFLEGVRQTAEGAMSTLERLESLFEEDRKKIRLQGRKSISALRVHDALKARPIISLQDARKRSKLSFPGAAAGMELLEKLGIAREITGRQWKRLYAYERYVAILNEGAEAE